MWNDRFIMLNLAHEKSKFFNFRKWLKVMLESVLKALINTFPEDWFYVQGLHDVVSILLITLNDEELTYKCSYQIIKHFISDFCWKSFEDGVIPLLNHCMNLIWYYDVDLYEILSFIETPTFSISWLITWFSHSLSYDKSARIFDFIISRGP